VTDAPPACDLVETRVCTDQRREHGYEQEKDDEEHADHAPIVPVRVDQHQSASRRNRSVVLIERTARNS
jgi:hypothetical protein